MKTQLYRFFDTSDKLLYVGVSISVAIRLQGHKSTAWFGRVSKIIIQTFDTRELALAAEIVAIKAECPEFNVTHNNMGPAPRRRPRTICNVPQGPLEEGARRSSMLTISDIMDDAKVSRWTVMRWCKRRIVRLKSTKIGNVRRIAEHDYARFKETLTPTPKLDNL